MPVLELGPFGGLIPKIGEKTPRNLPKECAVTAQNVDLTAGALQPINVVSPFTSLNNGSTLYGRVAQSEIITIPQPDTPTLDSVIRFCNPETWLTVKSRSHYAYIDPDTGVLTWTEMDEQTLAYQEVLYTRFGLEIRYHMAGFTCNMTGAATGAEYIVRGPLYQFIFTTGASAYLGAPLAAYTYPENDRPQDPYFPECNVPLAQPADWSNYPSDPAGWPAVEQAEYGVFQVKNIIGPRFDDVHREPANNEIYLDYSALDNTDVRVLVDLNYADQETHAVYYKQTYVRDTAAGEEGRESARSALVTAPPGHAVKINTTFNGGYNKNRLYRSVPGYDSYRYLVQHDAASYVDTFRLPLTTELETSEALPSSASTLAENSLLHPEGFAVVFESDTLHFSRVDKPWMYPDGWSITYDTNILAIALVGTTVIVWTVDGTYDGRVFAVTGVNPANMSSVEISATAKCVEKLSIVQIDQQLYYAGRDGVMAIAGGGVQNITKQHFTRSEWNGYSPSSMVGKTADGSIFLEVSGGTNFRIDLDEDIARVTTYTATSAVAATWKSKDFVYERPIRWTCGRCEAGDYTSVTLKLYGDGSLLATISVSGSGIFRVPKVQPARIWAVQIEANTASRVDYLRLATCMEDLS